MSSEVSDGEGLTEDGEADTQTDGEEAHHLPGLEAPVHVVLQRVEDGNKSELFYKVIKSL